MAAIQLFGANHGPLGRRSNELPLCPLIGPLSIKLVNSDTRVTLPNRLVGFLRVQTTLDIRSGPLEGVREEKLSRRIRDRSTLSG